MNVFIDANTLLDFFRLSGGDLDEIQKIIRLWKGQQINLLVSDCVKDEFYRNREKVIADSLSGFDKSKFELHRPNLVRVHPESVELEQLQSKFKQVKESLTDKVIEESRASNTKADRVIADLFAAANVQVVSDATVAKGIQRHKLGKPPGKANSCGDSIHWQWLLEIVPYGEDLCLISGDADFASPLAMGSLSSYLADEWQKLNKSKCHLYPTLTDFLRDRFATFRLADEDEKLAAIEKLETSHNFQTTHNAIASLTKFDDFSRPELLRLINAYESNNQIAWIIGDTDVKEFAEKIVERAHEAGLIEEVNSIEESLNELALQENEGA